MSLQDRYSGCGSVFQSPISPEVTSVPQTFAAPVGRSIGDFRRHVVAAALALSACVLMFGVYAADANAATYVVDNSTDNGALSACTGAANDCSLRGAITTANGDSTVDTIDFIGPGSVTIEAPLPPVIERLTIDGNNGAVSVVGSGTYDCSGSDYAIDITAAGAAQSLIVGLPISSVCGRAIKSNVAAPTIQVGPRRANNTVTINGTTASGVTSVEIHRVLDPAVSGESSEYFQSTAVATNAFAYSPAPLPTAGSRFAAVASGVNGTSAVSASATTPADLTSPSLLRAVATGNDVVRVDFDEPISTPSAPAQAFSLNVAGAARPITGTLVNGNSVFLYTSSRWATGEAGAVQLTGGVRVTDITGNEVLGEPSATVFAGPGEIAPITISNFRFTPQKMCSKKTRVCKRNYSYAYISLNKDARVIFKVYRGTKNKQRELVTFIRRLKAGRNKMKVTSSINGRNLPASTLTLRAVAQDVARTNSAPADAFFRLVKHRREL